MVKQFEQNVIQRAFSLNSYVADI